MESEEEVLVGSLHLSVRAVFHWFDKDGVAIDFDHDHDVCVLS